MYLTSYDRIIETLILLAVVTETWINWKSLQERQRVKIKRIVNEFLKGAKRD